LGPACEEKEEELLETLIVAQLVMTCHAF